MNKLLSQNLSRLWASLIINEFIQNKITQFYLSPGMRNAPLIAAIDHFKQFYPEIEIIICVDERAAAYHDSRKDGFSGPGSKNKALSFKCTFMYTSLFKDLKSSFTKITMTPDTSKSLYVNYTGNFTPDKAKELIKELLDKCNKAAWSQFEIEFDNSKPNKVKVISIK